MKFQRSLKPNVNVDLVPMIDVVFQLVIFFMVSSTLTIGSGIAVNLPDAVTTEQVVMTPLVIQIAGPNNIYMNSPEAMNLARFQQAVMALEEQDSDTVVIEASEDAVMYGLFIDVVDILRQAGITNYSLKTRMEN